MVEDKRKYIRQPIISVLAHVDHGKTTLLDYIRKTTIAKKEAGGITQHIGASEITKDALEEKCKSLLKKYNISIPVPGLLFIDTPGHEAFTLLRKRGGSLADISILIIDINEGIMPQTKESIEILKQYKTPFVVALNKIDRIHGWISHPGEDFLTTFNKQREITKQEFYNKLYTLIGQLSEYGFESELYYEIKDFTKTLALIPISALTGEGVSDLLTVIIGLVNKFLKDKLYIDPEDVGKGVVLEVKETRGLGVTIDAILYDGSIHKGDILIIANPDNIIETKVRGILKPAPMQELRANINFKTYDYVVAASGIKIASTGIENVIPGVSFVCLRKDSKKEDRERYISELRKDVETVSFSKDVEGVVIKGDALGSLEAIVNVFKRKGISIREAAIGNITKKDIMLLENMPEEKRIAIGFNVKIDEDAMELAKKNNVKVIISKVIYHILEEYEKYLEELRAEKEKKILEGVVYPFKMKFLEHFVFRQSKPAIIGCEVEVGIVKPNIRIMNQEGKIIGTILGIQIRGENIKEAKQGDTIAISVDKGFVGRNIKPGDEFYPVIPKEHYKILIENISLLKENEKNTLDYIKQLMKKHDPRYDIF